MHDQVTEVKVKSYNYELRNAGIFFSIVFSIIGLLMIFFSESYTVMLYAIYIFLLSSFVISVWVIFSLVFCQHFDIYTSEGFYHEYKGKIIYSVKWENVKKVSYLSSFLWNFIPRGASSMIEVEFFSEIKFNDKTNTTHHQHFLRPYCDYSVSNYINYNDMLKVIEFIPSNVEKQYPKKLTRYLAFREQNSNIKHT